MHHDEHSVSELPRSFIGISPIPGNPDPSQRRIGDRPSPQAPPSRRSHAHTAPALTRTRAHAPARRRRSSPARLAMHMPHRQRAAPAESQRSRCTAQHIWDRTACTCCRLDHSVQHALGNGGLRLGFGLAGDVESIKIGSLLWSCTANCTGETCTLRSGTAAAATPAGLTPPTSSPGLDSTCHISTGDSGRSSRNTPN